MKKALAVSVLMTSVSLSLPQRANAGGIRNPGLLVATIPLIGTATFTLIYSLFAEPPSQKPPTDFALITTKPADQAVRSILNNEILDSRALGPQFNSQFANGSQLISPK